MLQEGFSWGSLSFLEHGIDDGCIATDMAARIARSVNRSGERPLRRLSELDDFGGHSDALGDDVPDGDHDPMPLPLPELDGVAVDQRSFGSGRLT